METLTDWEVKELVYTWFKKITVKVPVEELLAMLNSEELEMEFPEETLRSNDDFVKWYKVVTNKFFNQVHEVKLLDVDISEGQAKVNLIVNWQAHTWDPPAPFSKWAGFDIHQTWIVKRDSNLKKAVITKYHVGKLEPMQGPLT